VINLRNITQSARNSAVLFANKILESVGVDKTIPTFTRKVKLDDSTVSGGITPNEGTVIGGYKEVKNVLDNIIPDSIKNFIGKKAVAGLETQAKAEYLYEINKGNPDKINELFTPEEQAIIQSRIEARDKASSDLATYLVDLGFLKEKDLADNYVRYVLSEAGRSQLKLDKKVPVVIGGKEYVFENIDQALTSLLARRQK